MPEMGPLPRASWLKRVLGYVPGRSGRTIVPAAFRARLAVKGTASSKDRSGKPSFPRDIEQGDASIARWPEEAAKVKVFVAEANARVCKQMADIQASIIFAQDNLSEDDEIARQALKRKIEYAEKFHQKACQFNAVVGDVMCVADLVPHLIKCMNALKPHDFAAGIASAPDPLDPLPVDLSRERTWVAKQLSGIRRELQLLESVPEGRSARRVSACVVTLNTVLRRLTRHIDDIAHELRHFAVLMDELDCFILPCDRKA